MKFALLEEKFGSTQSKFAKMMNSHPDSKKRAESVKKKATADGIWKEPEPVNIDKLVKAAS
jgi:putative metalloprotease